MFHNFSATLKTGQFRYTGRHKNLIAYFIFTLNKPTNVRSVVEKALSFNQDNTIMMIFEVFSSVTYTALTCVNIVFTMC